MIRKVSFPLKFKIIGLISLVLAGTVAFYINFAVNIFRQDKSADIFENTVNNASSLSAQVQLYMDELGEDLELLGNSSNSDIQSGLAKEILVNNGDILEFSLLNRDDLSKHLVQILNRDLIESYEMDASYLEKINNIELISMVKGLGEKLVITKSRNGAEIPHFWAIKKNKRGVIFARVTFETIEKILGRRSIYDNFLIDDYGHNFLPGKMLDFEFLVKEKLGEGARKRERKSGGIDLLGFSKLSYPLLIISVIDESRAYRAANVLVNKSLYYGLFVLSLSIIASVFFSRKLTGELSKLFGATQKIAEGDFSHELALKGRDEIGALSDSFNFMGKEILRYMDEMVEKVRLENEVNVAKLVQESFFPQKDFRINDCAISTFYSPASECGGDWFDAFEIEGKIIFIIADATGHGVPAALVTATANCCAQNIKFLKNSFGSIAPENILQLMNHGVLGTGKDILMTAFVAVYDPDTKKMSYANASHNPPLLIKKKDSGEYSRQDFIPLMGETGPRLGHVENSEYPTEVIEIAQFDRVVFFTDGIVEGKNNEDKDYGQRRFLKSMGLHAKECNAKFCQGTIDDAYDFYGDIPQDDDISLMTVEFGSTQIDIPRGNRENVLEILAVDGPDHLFGEKSLYPEKERDIINRATSSGTFWGLENYLREGMVTSKNKVCDSREIEQQVQEQLAGLPFNNVFDQAKDQMASIARELLSNALYHSGVEGINFEERSSQERTVPMTLSESECALFQMGEDEEYMAISVCDQTGLLTKDKVISSLERSFKEMKPEEKDGGAGLGLYMSYQNSNIMIVNRQEKKRVEIIAIIEKTKRFRKYQERITSFHYFEES